MNTDTKTITENLVGECLGAPVKKFMWNACGRGVEKASRELDVIDYMNAQAEREGRELAKPRSNREKLAYHRK